MAKIATVGTAGRQGCLDLGAGDLVAANPFEQSVGRVRHMAVITKTSGRFGRVMGVRFHVAAKFLVALKARLVAFLAPTELMVRIALVHRMARETGEIALLKTGRLDQPIVFPARDPNHAVRPKEV